MIMETIELILILSLAISVIHLWRAVKEEGKIQDQDRENAEKMRSQLRDVEEDLLDLITPMQAAISELKDRVQALEEQTTKTVDQVTKLELGKTRRRA